MSRHVDDDDDDNYDGGDDDIWYDVIIITTTTIIIMVVAAPPNYNCQLQNTFPGHPLPNPTHLPLIIVIMMMLMVLMMMMMMTIIVIAGTLQITISITPSMNITHRSPALLIAKKTESLSLL